MKVSLFSATLYLLLLAETALANPTVTEFGVTNFGAMLNKRGKPKKPGKTGTEKDDSGKHDSGKDDSGKDDDSGNHDGGLDVNGCGVNTSPSTPPPPPFQKDITNKQS